MLTGSLVRLGGDHRRPVTGSVESLGGVFVQTTSETSQGTGGGRSEDQGLRGFAGLLDDGRQCRESRGSDKVLGPLSENYFDAVPGVDKFEYELRCAQCPRSGADRDEDQKRGL
jgi:hypothetical protein